MIQTTKQICEMGYDELNGLKIELEQQIEELEDTLYMSKTMFSHVIGLIDRMDDFGGK